VDIVLGMSMAPSTVRMVLVEGENAQGATVDEDGFEVAPAQDVDDPAPTSGADQVIAAIMGTREGATEGGYRLTSTGVTWTDPIEAGVLRDALAARKIENVMLVSAFLAAAALAQTVGTAKGYTHTGLLFVEADSATLAVIDSADGSIADVRRELLPDDDTEAVAQLTAMAAGVDGLDSGPQGLFVVGSGVDIAMIKSELEAATSLAVSTPGEPETALARGAALASAQAPSFDSSTAALAYAQDPGTGAVDPIVALAGGVAVAGEAVDHDATENRGLAYSAAPDDDADAYTAVADDALSPRDATMFGFDAFDGTERERKPFLVALGALMVFVVGVATLAMALAFDIRPRVDERPTLGQSVVVPAKPAPAPAPAAPPLAPAAPALAPAAPAPAPAAPAAPPAIPQLPAPRLPMPGPGPLAPGPGPMPGIPHGPGPGLPGLPHGGGGIPHLPGLGGFHL
jgi:hypothetical protein